MQVQQASENQNMLGERESKGIVGLEGGNSVVERSRSRKLKGSKQIGTRRRDEANKELKGTTENQNATHAKPENAKKRKQQSKGSIV